MEILGLKIAPFHVRTLETLSVAFILLFAFGSLWVYPLTFYVIFYFPTLRYFLLPYFVWMYYDWDTQKKGGRSMRWVRIHRRSALSRYFRNYFPLKLVKTADLDPNRNYLFAAFPHGVLPMGAAGIVGYEYSGQNELFPGLEIRLATLSFHFMTPLVREHVHFMGYVDSSAKSIIHQLSTKPEPPYTGKATFLFPGGVAELLECRPNAYRIVIKRRKGFVRLALMHGSPLVPVFSFGETNTYDPVYGPKGSLWRRIQDCSRRLIGVTPLILKGRGIIPIPRRTLITVVVGKPIELPKIEEPTKEQIDEYHGKFIEELVNLFETNKHKYHENADSIKLELIE